MSNNLKDSLVKNKAARVTAASHSSKQHGKGMMLQDNRSHSVIQQKLISNVFSEKQPAGNGAVIQAKSLVRNVGQAFKWGPHQTIVGHSMKAWLDPADPLRGESASANADQTPMMDAIRAQYQIDGGDLVKGHLLNDNLGGKALNNNLFPITREANKRHLLSTENYAKTELWTNNHPLWYTVDVIGKPDISQPDHQFNVALGPWDMVNNKEYPPAIQYPINSHLTAPRFKDPGDPLQNYSAETLKIAIARGRAHEPHAGSGTMNQKEQYERHHSGQIVKSQHDNTGLTVLP